MNKETVINLISKNIRLIHLEKGYSQEKMATVSGISKKTLVQVENEVEIEGDKYEYEKNKNNI